MLILSREIQALRLTHDLKILVEGLEFRNEMLCGIDVLHTHIDVDESRHGAIVEDLDHILQRVQGKTSELGHC